MRTLEEIKGRCHIAVGGCWLWRGSLRHDGRANIYAPDYTRGPDVMSTQNGPRAVWHCKTGQPIPEGWRAYGTCENKACCNPAHVACTPCDEFGDWISKTGRLKDVPKRILANRLGGRKRAKLTPEVIAHILASDKTGVELAAELSLSRETVSKARNGRTVAYQAAGPMFAGLVKFAPQRRGARA